MLSSNFWSEAFLRTSSIPSSESFFLVLLISLNKSHLSLASLASILAIWEGSSGFLLIVKYGGLLLWYEANRLGTADNIPDTIGANDDEHIVDINIPNFDFWLTGNTNLVTVEITKGACDGEPRTLVISPDTVGTLRLFISVDLTTCLDDSLLFNLSVWLVISGKLECANLSSSLLCVGKLSWSAQYSSWIADVCCVYAVFNLEDSDAAGTTLPIVLLFVLILSY